MSECEHKQDLRDGMWVCNNPELDKTLEENAQLRSHLKRIISAANVPCLDNGQENDGHRVVEMEKNSFFALENTIRAAREYVEENGG